MQDYINEILHRINEEMELLGIDENVCVEDALHMIDVIRPLFDNLRNMTVKYEFQNEEEEIRSMFELTERKLDNEQEYISCLQQQKRYLLQKMFI